MAKLPPIKRFVLDDFNGITEISAFASKLFYPLNLFLNAVYSALANGLTLSSNTISVVSTQTSIKSSSVGIATTTINWGFPQSPPVGLVVMNCTLSSVPALTPLISWSYSAGVISITMQFVTVSGAAIVPAAAGTYALTFWANGG